MEIVHVIQLFFKSKDLTTLHCGMKTIVLYYTSTKLLYTSLFILMTNYQTAGFYLRTITYCSCLPNTYRNSNPCWSNFYNLRALALICSHHGWVVLNKKPRPPSIFFCFTRWKPIRRHYLKASWKELKQLVSGGG